jgi:hypothetical protein
MQIFCNHKHPLQKQGKQGSAENISSSSKFKIYAAMIPVRRIIGITLIPAITVYAPYALAVDLNAGAKEFFDPVLKVITDYSSTAIFAGGTIGAVVAPGDLRTKFGGALGGMAVAGLVVLASKKMLGVG